MYVGMFAVVALVVLLPLLWSRVSGTFIAPIIVSLLLLFAGIVAIGSGRALDVFAQISGYFAGTRKFRYLAKRPAAGSVAHGQSRGAALAAQSERPVSRNNRLDKR